MTCRKRVVETAAAVLLLSALLTVASLCTAQGSGALEQVSNSLRMLSDKVSPAVVEIRASKYGSSDEENGESGMVVKQRVIGSGVIIDPDGYIVTNAHVVDGAKRIRVILNRAHPDVSPSRRVAEISGSSYDATLVGADEETDIAVLKIHATKLPTLPFANYGDLRQGQMVVAIGNPLGAHSAVTIGVISSVARQIDSDNPTLYIQTDAALNPGNSGGPLVNTSGKLVGINSLIMDGDSLGLAIPSDTVKYAYEQIRSCGRVRHADIGLEVQDITSTMASGLRLARDSGIMVADVRPGGPAERAGIKAEDIIVKADGEPAASFVEFVSRVYRKNPGEHVTVQLLRNNELLDVKVPVVERNSQPDLRAKTPDPERNLIRGLGIYAIEVDADSAESISGIRLASGVLVTGKSMTEKGSESQSELDVGDVIHRLNGVAIRKIGDLRKEVEKLKSGDPIVLQVERKRKMLYVSFELER